MNLVDLIVTVCSLAHPHQSCEVRHMLFQSHGSLTACMAEAPPYLARWQSEHPALKVVRWQCAWPEQEKQDS